ncbi:MAG: efflux RND transporter periplasmic adaptor subunit [Planctomycetota bacterium]|nr:efflux RND transporter periplasmic adaptor subunit [Planctomycetota bacterium]
MTSPEPNAEPRDHGPGSPPRAIRLIVATLRFILPVAVVVGAIYGSMILIGSRPQAPRIDTEERATLVETMVPEVRDARAVITGYGTVEAHRTLSLQTQVGGEILSITPSMIPGGMVAAGDVLLKIDPLDYELALEQRRADLANAEVNLQIAQASSLVAKREWELLGDSIDTSDIGEQLARKEPQKREAEARLEAAKGKLKLAQLDLKRTTVTAPFNAVVLDDSIELGQIIAPRTTVATLVGTDEFEVIASIPLAKLPLIVIDPEAPENNSPATVTLELGDGQTLQRAARVARLAGEVERSGRLAKVIIQILDPLNREEVADRGVLLLGSYVRVEIEGPTIAEVVELPRSVLQENDTVWVMDANRRLAIRSYELVLGRNDSILAKVEFENGDELITSPLGIAISGMRLESLDQFQRSSGASDGSGS